MINTKSSIIRIYCLWFSILFLLSSCNYKPKITECDKLAAHSYDMDAISVGIASNKINSAKAIKACKSALKDNPDEARLIYQLARANNEARNKADALKLYKKAAIKGYARANYELGQLYRNGKYGFQKDSKKSYAFYNKAFLLHSKAAEKGNAVAQNVLGDHYYMGYGTSENNNYALFWYHKSAEQGNKGSIKQLVKVKEYVRKQKQKCENVEEMISRKGLYGYKADFVRGIRGCN